MPKPLMGSYLVVFLEFDRRLLFDEFVMCVSLLFVCFYNNFYLLKLI
jgi:hypothetical protein